MPWPSTLKRAIGRSRNGLNVVANKQDYWARLQTAIQHLHHCAARHRNTVQVHDVVHGQIVWKGEVEVFDLEGHPKAHRCYGWSQPGGNDDQDERLVIVLEIPPVVSAETAVRASIMADTKNK